ncbi:sigma-70 family RNA polymerase sigma factor [Streptomyces carminius]|uniref:Sigma-70 family RNA polymerase sigma factor n=1 Tax=Streptomyces carminius TaxID=2665496 RepID=A0A2M8LVU6_9ACTN|nr:sigma-70 family RNA polymerase sigma factor [Streptomyces carminius]PJE96080.1 sigma-70 family RNA polymerase sigma factor [Streptomyces carminius]
MTFDHADRETDGGGPGRRPVRAPLPLPLDVQAFYLGHQELYHDYAEAQLGDRRAAEDAVHEVFREIRGCWYELLREGNLEQRAWAVVRRIVAARLEDEERPPAFVLNGPVTRALRAARDQFRILHGSRGLYEAIADLPPRQFDVIVLRYVLGYPPDKIAWFMGLHERTVDYHARRAKEHLRSRLGLPAPAARRGRGRA